MAKKKEHLSIDTRRTTDRPGTNVFIGLKEHPMKEAVFYIDDKDISFEGMMLFGKKIAEAIEELHHGKT